MVKVALALITTIFLCQIGVSLSSNYNQELGNNIVLNYDDGIKWKTDPNPVNFFQGNPSFKSDEVACPNSKSISGIITGPGELNFAWKKSSNSSVSLSDYTNFSFYVDNIKKISCDNSSWDTRGLEIGNGSHVVKWEFRLDRGATNSRCGCPCNSHGQGWIAYIEYINGQNISSPQIVPPPSQLPKAPRLSQVRVANMLDLKKLVENSDDLMGVTLLLGNGPYNGNLIINARNFTLKPNDGQKGEINGLKNNEDTIKLNSTSHVTISNLNINGYFCQINLERSKNCLIEGNTIEALDGWGIYLGNFSIENNISNNNLISHGHSDDQPIVVYHSDHNIITYNKVICTQSGHFCLKDSYENSLRIHPGDDFYIDSSHYILGQNFIFYKFIDSFNPSQIDGDPTKYNVSIGENWWRCCL